MFSAMLLTISVVALSQFAAYYWRALGTPDLRSGPGGLGLVKFYYHAVRGLGKVAGGFSQSFVEWTERESVLCARYAAVQIDRRLQANLELAASIRSC